MKKLDFGEVAILENGEEYTCFANVELEGKTYAFLMKHTTQTSIKIARQDLVDGRLSLTIIKDETQKKKILNLYIDFLSKSIESLIE